MAFLFALTTSVLLALGASWSAYFALSQIRTDVTSFIAHELSELAMGIQATAGSPGEIQPLVDNIARVSKEPPCAFRVRDASGAVIASSGPSWLLETVPDRVGPKDSWRKFLFSDGVAIGARLLEPYDLQVELIIDTGAALTRIRDYLISALVAFLVSVVFAGLSGWFTAHRGLRSLREVVAQARAINLPSESGLIRLDNAPEEVREVGNELNAMLMRIESGLDRMRTFTASLAHELRSPLQNLIGETEVTLLAERDAAEYRDVLRSHLDDLHDLSDAVDNLVAFCRSSEPLLTEAIYEDFDLAEEAQIRLERERRAARREGIEIEVTVRGDTRLRADREGCLRVVRNLVSNAVSASPRGTRVRVILEGLHDKVRITVEDDGPGIPPEMEKRIFEPFVTGPRQPGRRQGYGLGLAICRSVVQDHRGNLRFANRTSGGTRFVAELPRSS
ncbi:MAG: ATP-binding protein [Planctomycetota bacterium]